MKKYYWLFLLVAVCFTGAFSVNAQDNSGKNNKQVKLATSAVEVIEVTNSAKECGTQKSIFVRLRIVSASPVDVRGYVSFGRVKLLSDFTDKKQGDEISIYNCNPEASFKFVSRSAGSSEEFPKP